MVISVTINQTVKQNFAALLLIHQKEKKKKKLLDYRQFGNGDLEFTVLVLGGKGAFCLARIYNNGHNVTI